MSSKFVSLHRAADSSLISFVDLKRGVDHGRNWSMAAVVVSVRSCPMMLSTILRSCCPLPSSIELIILGWLRTSLLGQSKFMKVCTRHRDCHNATDAAIPKFRFIFLTYTCTFLRPSMLYYNKYF